MVLKPEHKRIHWMLRQAELTILSQFFHADNENNCDYYELEIIVKELGTVSVTDQNMV